MPALARAGRRRGGRLPGPRTATLQRRPGSHRARPGRRLAFALIVAAVVTPRSAQSRPTGRAASCWLLALAALALHSGLLYTSLPAIYLRLDAGRPRAVPVGRARARGRRRICPVAHAALGQAAAHRRAGDGHFALGVWMIHRSPDPAIDVHMFHRYSIAALRVGCRSLRHHVSGHLQQQRLLRAWTVPQRPAAVRVSVFSARACWLSLPGQLLFKDPRYAQLVAIELAAMLMAFARFAGFGPIAAALYLTTPRIFFVLEQSWTEPILVLGLAARDLCRVPPQPRGPVAVWRVHRAEAVPGVRAACGRRCCRVAARPPPAGDVPDEGGDSSGPS